MATIIYANALPFIALTIFLFLIHANPLFIKRQNNLFQAAVVICMVLLVAISADYIISRMGVTDYWPLRRFTTFLNFASAPYIPLLLYMIFASEESKLPPLIPCLLNTVLCFISLFTPLIFTITDKNVYTRGPLFFFPFTVSVCYLLILMWKIKKFRQRRKKGERVFLIVAVILLSGGLYMEVILHYRFLSWDCASVCLILYYLLLNINDSTTDPLTGAYNRSMHTRELSLLRGRAECTIALLDINDFKQVNDVYGHSAGDKFLQQFVALMQLHLPKTALFYRTGGDEFSVLSKAHSVAEMKHILLEIRQIANEQNMDFAFGISALTPQGDPEEAQKIADQAMYADKYARKNADRQ